MIKRNDFLKHYCKIENTINYMIISKVYLTINKVYLIDIYAVSYLQCIYL